MLVFSLSQSRIKFVRSFESGSSRIIWSSLKSLDWFKSVLIYHIAMYGTTKVSEYPNWAILDSYGAQYMLTIGFVTASCSLPRLCSHTRSMTELTTRQLAPKYACASAFQVTPLFYDGQKVPKDPDIDIFKRENVFGEL